MTDAPHNRTRFAASADLGLGAPAKAVFVALAAHAGADGLTWVSAATLAQWTELAQRTVNKQLAKLQEAGWVVVLGEGPGQTQLRWVAHCAPGPYRKPRLTPVHGTGVPPVDIPPVHGAPLSTGQPPPVHGTAPPCPRDSRRDREEGTEGRETPPLPPCGGSPVDYDEDQVEFILRLAQASVEHDPEVPLLPGLSAADPDMLSNIRLLMHQQSRPQRARVHDVWVDESPAYHGSSRRRTIPASMREAARRLRAGME